MSYREFQEVPAYQRARFAEGGAGLVNQLQSGELLWSNDRAPPAIGERFIFAMNGIGAAVCVGYFAEDKWLGVLCDIENAPDWHKRQNKGNARGHAFGAEIKYIDQENAQ